MKLATLISTLLLTLTVAMGATLHEPSVPEKLQGNTVVLTLPHGHGSGALFTNGDSTFIWTAAHVADNWERMDGTFALVDVVQGDKRGKAEVIRSGDCESGVDVALLCIVEGDFTGTTTFYRDFNNVYVGQKVIHCGTPLNRRWHERLIRYGRVSNANTLLEGAPLLTAKQLDQIHVTAYPGCSGGPVIDEETEGIIGLLVMGSGPGLEVIEPTRRIFTWAKEHDCLWAFDSSLDLPENIVAWPSDMYLRKVKERDCPIDGWGDVKQESPKDLEEIHKSIQTIIDIIDAVIEATTEPAC